MCIDTVFICFCEDCEINNGQDQPYFMSRGLMVNGWLDKMSPSFKLMVIFLCCFRNLSKRVKKLCELALVEIVLGNNNPRKGRTITTRRWIRMPAFGTLAFRLLRINSVPLPLLSAPKDKKGKRSFWSSSHRQHDGDQWVICRSYFLISHPLIKTKVPKLTTHQNQ
jgi:hypothetical protein